MSYDDYDEARYGDYDIPFPGMSEEDFLYRAMNPEDPMYMGPEDEDIDDEDDLDEFDDEDEDDLDEFDDEDDLDEFDDDDDLDEFDDDFDTPYVKPKKEEKISDVNKALYGYAMLNSLKPTQASAPNKSKTPLSTAPNNKGCLVPLTIILLAASALLL